MWANYEGDTYCECDCCGDEVSSARATEKGPHFCCAECRKDYIAYVEPPKPIEWHLMVIETMDDEDFNSWIYQRLES